MADLEPNTVLARVHDLSVRVHANEEIVVSRGLQSIRCGRYGLAVLDAFARPRTFADAVAELQPRAAGSHDWVELTRTIHALHQAGMVTGPDGNNVLPAAPRGYDNPKIHIEMLDDRARTSAFLAGISEMVRPGDVVVDLGTGTGVLAVAAVRAGARHVYAVEAAAIGRSAQALFEQNGLADRITLVEGWSHHVTLPERADVLVTEMVGHDPFGEALLELVRDARKRLLVPEPRFVPESVRAFVVPVSVPKSVLAGHQFSLEAADRWRSWYGIDFDSLATGRVQLLMVSPSKARRWKTFSEAAPVAEIELATVENVAIDARVEVTARAGGRITGALVFFELQLTPGVALSVRPEVAGDTHWRCPVWLLPEPVHVRPGDRLTVSYRYGVAPDDGVTVERIS